LLCCSRATALSFRPVSNGYEGHSRIQTDRRDCGRALEKQARTFQNSEDSVHDRRRTAQFADNRFGCSIKNNLEVQGMIPSGGTPQRFGERIRKDYDRWVKVVREQNIKPE
jgi:hypothetical protein